MKNQSIRRKNILIRFNKNLYNLKSIKLAIKEYQNLADFSLRQKNNYIEVVLKKINLEVRSIIKDEFCNYILFLMKSN